MPVVKNAKSKKRIKGKEDLSTLVLPTHVLEPSQDFTDYTTLIFGKKGMGKTSLASYYPNAIVNQFEAKREHLPILQVPKRGEKALTWPRFKAYLELELNTPKLKSIVVDTVDRCWDQCVRWICKESGIQHPNDANDYGKTWALCSEEFERTLNGIKQAGKTPVYLSHGKHKPVQDVLKDEALEMFIPTCPDRCWTYLQSVCDFVFCYTNHGAQRVLVVRPTDTVWASCGVPDTFLHSKSKRPLLEIAMGSNAKEAYSILEKAFENKAQGRSVPTDQVLSEDYEEEEVEEELVEEKKPVKKKSFKKK